MIGRRPVRRLACSIGACIAIVAAPAVTAQAPAGAAQTVRPGTDLPEGVAAREVRFFSEAVVCYARIFTPKGFGADSKAAAVVLAPVPGETAASTEKYAVQFALRGLVAMTFDYRGWGRSGAFLYLVEPLRWDDRLRFSQHTARMRLRRKRLVPEAQILDIRNAISYLQGEPGVDRARIGVWGADLAGGHSVTAAAIDIRVKAAVAQVPVIPGKDLPRRAVRPDPERQAQMVKLARAGQASAYPESADLMNALEARLAQADYHPFWYADQIPEATAVLFIIAGNDSKVNNETHAIAASRLLKGPNGVTVIPGATHNLASPGAFEAAVDAAAAWFQKYL
jgi:dienelactone hydrolase